MANGKHTKPTDLRKTRTYVVMIRLGKSKKIHPTALYIYNSHNSSENVLFLNNYVNEPILK